MPHSGPGLECPRTPPHGGGDRAGPPPPGAGLWKGPGREDLRTEGCRQRIDDCSRLTKASSAFPPPRGAKRRMFVRQEP